MQKTKMLRNPERISYEDLKQRITAITSLYDRALACLAYASGARASELNKIKRQDIQKETINGKEFLTIGITVLKKHKIKHYQDDGEFFDEQKAGKKIKRLYTKYAETFNPELHRRYNLVKPQPFYRRGLAIVGKEDWLIDNILEFANSYKEPTDIVFPIHRATIYKKLTSALESSGEQINPHGFRKLRATHLVKVFGFKHQQLKEFFGWSNSAQADSYVRLGLQDIAESMAKSSE